MQKLFSKVVENIDIGEKDKTRLCFDVLQQAGITHPIDRSSSPMEFMVPILSSEHPPPVYNVVKECADVLQFFYGMNVLSVSLQSNMMTSLYTLCFDGTPLEDRVTNIQFRHWIGSKGLTAPMIPHGGGVTLMIGDACGTCVCYFLI